MNPLVEVLTAYAIVHLSATSGKAREWAEWQYDFRFKPILENDETVDIPAPA